MSATLMGRQLRDLAERIESEADTASRHGQYASLHRIAADLREVIEGLTTTDPTPCSHASSTGIDTTPINDPAKVWRCHDCDSTWSKP